MSENTPILPTRKTPTACPACPRKTTFYHFSGDAPMANCQINEEWLGGHIAQPAYEATCFEKPATIA